MMVRLEDGSWNTGSLARLLVATAENGIGATFVTDTLAEGRYVVAVTDERYTGVSDTAATVLRVASFIEATRDRVNGFGVWVSDTGETCIDAVLLVHRLDNALFYGRTHNQEEVYDSVLDTCFKV